MKKKHNLVESKLNIANAVSSHSFLANPTEVNKIIIILYMILYMPRVIYIGIG